MAATPTYPGRYLNPEKVEAQRGPYGNKEVTVFFNGMFKVACPPGSLEEKEQTNMYKQGYHISKNEYRVSEEFLKDIKNYNS